MKIKGSLKILLLLFAAAFIIAGFAACDSGKYEQELFYEPVEGGYELVTGLLSSDGELIVPSTYQGLPVVSIGRKAFHDSTELKHLVISPGIKEIKDGAFINCANIKTISLGEGLLKIGSAAFARAFDTTCPVDIVIPEGVTEIGSQAFCGSLESQDIRFARNFSLPSTLETIGNQAFYNQKIEEITLPDGLSDIDNGAFWKVCELTEINIPDSVKHIGQLAFSECTKLNKLNLGEGVEIIEYAAFSDCYALEEVTVPESVTTIGSQVFRCCKKLKKVTIKGNNLSNGMFNECEVLDTVVFSANVKKIETSVMSGCKTKPDVIYLGTAADWAQTKGISWFTGSDRVSSIKFGDKDIKELDLTDATKIEKRAFYGFEWVESVYLPESVTSIGTDAFNGITAKTVLAPAEFIDKFDLSKVETLTLTGEGELKKDALKSATVLKKFTATGLTKATAGEFSETVVEEATVNAALIFALNKETIKTVNAVAGESITEGALTGCKKLQTVTLSDTVKTISPNAFKNCAALTEITLPEGLTSIGSGAFYGCTALTSLITRGKVAVVSEKAFFGCDNLKEIDLGASIKTVGISAFEGCNALKKIKLGRALKEICSDAFYECYSLAEIVYGGDKAAWGEVVKGEGWADDLAAGCVVKCTDGDIPV